MKTQSNTSKSVAKKTESENVVEEKISTDVHALPSLKECEDKFGTLFTIKYSSAKLRRKMSHDEAIKFCLSWFEKQV